MKVFVHISDDSLYLGNGGLRSMTHLASACAEMGHETYVFGQKDRLSWDKFYWLSWDDFNFKITENRNLFKQKGEFRIVTSWLNRLMPLVEGALFGNFRYLERDEIARAKYARIAAFIRKYFRTIGLTNRSLARFYPSFNIIPLENWFREDLFYYDSAKKIEGTIGFQGATKLGFKQLEDQFGNRMVICEGNQARVAGRMRYADFFVYANPPKRSVTLYRGEGFGNPLYEAMACGCVCLALKHNGTEYLEDTIPLVHDVAEAVTLIKLLSESKKKEVREKGLALVEERFRLNDEKKKNIERLLE